MKKMTLKALRLQIIRKFQKVDGQFALAFCDVSNPSNQILINEKVTFHAASTMKTPVMIEVFKQAFEGKFQLDDNITVKNTFTSIADGSKYSLDIGRDGDDTLYHQIGKQKRIRDLTYEMIIYSSNLATNNIIELVGADNVMDTMHEMRAYDIRIRRGVEDMKAFEAGLNNTTTAYDLMLIFKQMALGKIVSKEVCDEMTNILLDQKTNNIIPAKLPQNVKIAHKTGEVEGSRHDSGIVLLPDGRKYILVILSKNLTDLNNGIEWMADLSLSIFNFMNESPN